VLIAWVRAGIVVSHVASVASSCLGCICMCSLPRTRLCACNMPIMSLCLHASSFHSTFAVMSLAPPPCITSSLPPHIFPPFCRASPHARVVWRSMHLPVDLYRSLVAATQPHSHTHTHPHTHTHTPTHTHSPPLQMPRRRDHQRRQGLLQLLRHQEEGAVTCDV